MTLREKRVLFTRCLAALLTNAQGNWHGYSVALDQVKRTQAEADANAARGIGIRNSLHVLGLAADLLVYGPDGEYLTGQEDYEWLGQFWLELHAKCRWGGNFSKPDPGHFSIEHEGVQ